MSNVHVIISDMIERIRNHHTVGKIDAEERRVISKTVENFISENDCIRSGGRLCGLFEVGSNVLRPYLFLHVEILTISGNRLDHILRIYGDGKIEIDDQKYNHNTHNIYSDAYDRAMKGVI